MKNVESKASERSGGAPPSAAHLGQESKGMTMSMDRGVEMLKEWQVFMQAGADLMSDNAKATATDLKAFSACRTNEDFSKASAAFGASLASRWLESGQKLAHLSTDYAARRFQAMTSNGQHREG
jgi:hypothetical protein